MDEKEDVKKDGERQEPVRKVYRNAKEELYDKIPISLGTLDVIIKVLAAAAVLVTILGMIAGRNG